MAIRLRYPGSLHLVLGSYLYRSRQRKRERESECNSWKSSPAFLHTIDTDPLFAVFLHHSLSLYGILSLVFDNLYLYSFFPSFPTPTLHIIQRLSSQVACSVIPGCSSHVCPYIITFPFQLVCGNSGLPRPTDMIPINSASQFSEDAALTFNIVSQHSKQYCVSHSFP
jgi:hypothetical protein